MEARYDYAILFRKELVNTPNLLYLLKPCRVIEGFFDEKNKVFLDEMNEELMLVDDAKIMYDEVEYVVGAVYNQEQLLERYPDARSVDEAKIKLYKDAKEMVTFVFYDYSSNAMKTYALKADQITNFYGKNEPEKKNVEKKTSMKFYEKICDMLGRKDITVFSLGDYQEMIGMDSLKDIKDKLAYLKEHKEEYGIKAGDMSVNGRDIILTADDDLIDQLMSISNIDEIKEYLDVIYEKFMEQYYKLKKDANVNKEEVPISADAVLQGFDEYQMNIANAKNLKEFKIVLQSGINALKDNITPVRDIPDYKDYIELMDSFIIELQKAMDETMTEEELPKAKLKLAFFYKSHLDDLTDIIYNITDLKKKKLKEEKEETSLSTKANQKEVTTPSQEETHAKKQKELEDVFSEEQRPAYYFDFKKVHDSMVSRLIGRDAQIDSILSVIKMNDDIQDDYTKRPALIIAGTTGTGKTQTYSELTRALKDIRPVQVVDTNQITAQGYVGGTIEDNILAPLIQQAHVINQRAGISNDEITIRDIELARHSIVILDEIDKRAEGEGDRSNVNKSGVVNQLLKLMDQGTKYIVKVGRNTVEFDTSRLTIFAAGAFQEYFDKEEEKVGLKGPIGFRVADKAEVKEDPKDEFAKHNEVKPEDLVKYGLDSQFVGRYDHVVLYPRHTKETLYELETNKSTSNIYAAIQEFARMGIDLVWEDGYLEEVVDKAYELKTGGRALGNIVSRTLGNIRVEVQRRPDMFKTIYIPLNAFEESGNIVLQTKDDKIVTLDSLYKETEAENNRLRKLATIEVNKEALAEVKKLLLINAEVETEAPKQKAMK